MHPTDGQVDGEGFGEGYLALVALLKVGSPIRKLARRSTPSFMSFATSHLRFGVVPRVPEAEVTLDRLTFAGTKQMPSGPVRLAVVHFAYMRSSAKRTIATCSSQNSRNSDQLGCRRFRIYHLAPISACLMVNGKLDAMNSISARPAGN